MKRRISTKVLQSLIEDAKLAQNPLQASPITDFPQGAKAPAKAENAEVLGAPQAPPEPRQVVTTLTDPIIEELPRHKRVNKLAAPTKLAMTRRRLGPKPVDSLNVLRNLALLLGHKGRAN